LTLTGAKTQSVFLREIGDGTKLFEPGFLRLIWRFRPRVARIELEKRVRFPGDSQKLA